MTATTIFLIILSLVVAAGLSYFQYFYKAKTLLNVYKVLAFLRFVAIFSVLLLLINPVITHKSFEVVKSPLILAVDNSSSIVDLKADKSVQEVYEKLSANAALKDKFDVQSYQFDQEVAVSNTFDFKGKQTNLELLAKNIKSVYRSNQRATVIITDGNQTTGNDYVYSFDAEQAVYPIAVGDTTTFLDLRIAELNVNKYAFHKNKFPAEIFLNYSGTKSVSGNFKIVQGNNTLFTQQVSFSPDKKSMVIQALLPAEKPGLQVYKAIITSSEKEKNSYNNTKNFAVEVLDQKTNVALVSAINHPDLGALKRSIETNPQRKVRVLKPSEFSATDQYNLLIAYQPTADFKPVFEAAHRAGINMMIVTGVNTDYSFLNQQQSNLVFKMSGQREDYTAGFESGFNWFSVENIGFEQFPPLQNAFGTITVNGNVSTLLSAKIRNIDIEMPLLAFAENQGKRMAYWLGENAWKWRLQSHVDNKSFEKYDVFVDKMVQYLTSNNIRKSLVVHHERFYNSGDALEITAQYFNKNYEPDEQARLTINVVNKNTKQTKKYDLLKTNNAFKVNLDGLTAGQYSFSVKELNTNTVYNGTFEVLDFDIEKQFVNPDLNKLKQLAAQTKGQVYVPNQVDALMKSLLENPKYQAVEKAIVRKTPIIDWVWLLVIAALALTAEWFTRKYNGLL